MEHAPFYFGKFLKNTIKKVNLYHDLFVRDALKNVDICFIGGEGFTKSGDAIVKKGTHVVTEISQKEKVPIYVISQTLKYDSDNNYKKLLQDNNYEILPKEHITGFITEHGIFKPEQIVEETLFFNKWLLIPQS